MKSASSILAFIVGGIVGLVGVALMVVSILACLANTLDVLNGRSIASYIPLLGGVLVGGLLLLLARYLFANPEREAEAERNEEAARRKVQDEKARLTAEKDKIQRALAAKSAERARAISNVSQLVSSAQGFASQLPTMLGEAELALDTAEKELAEGLYSPFWEAMEKSALMVSEFDTTLRDIDDARKQHSRQAPQLAPDVVDFSLGVSLLPDPSETMRRMNALYRQAQKDPHFAQVYEQRRTNAILIEGFRSLGEAVTSLGNRLTSALNSLGAQIDFRLTDVESALRESADRMEEQQSALIEAAKDARREAMESSAELASIARDSAEHAEKDAASRRAHEAESREMLDNIQRRRKPFPRKLRDGEY